MRIMETLSSAFYSVTSSKMRSLLTMLGIIIGISSVIMITAIGVGLQKTVQEEFAAVGANALTIKTNNAEIISESDALTLEDAELVGTHPNIDAVVPYVFTYGNVQLKLPDETVKSLINGVNEDYLSMSPTKIIYGRFLSEQEVKNSTKSVVIDENLATEVFGRPNVVGEEITAYFAHGTQELTVVGVMENEEFAGTTGPPQLFIPVTTVMDDSDLDLWTIYANVFDVEQIEKTASELTKMMDVTHGTKEKYLVKEMQQGMDSFNVILGSITAFVGLVAAISLFVGGIGVMNIMLVTVTERTREIGIRKSLGATDGNIQFQFLIEAIILTAVGGILGIILGYLGAFALGSAINITPAVSLPIIVGTVLISSAVGIIFGVYPAGKAAKLDPIEALRYE